MHAGLPFSGRSQCHLDLGNAYRYIQYIGSFGISESGDAAVDMPSITSQKGPILEVCTPTFRAASVFGLRHQTRQNHGRRAAVVLIANVSCVLCFLINACHYLRLHKRPMRDVFGNMFLLLRTMIAAFCSGPASRDPSREAIVRHGTASAGRSLGGVVEQQSATGLCFSEDLEIWVILGQRLTTRSRFGRARFGNCELLPHRCLARWNTALSRSRDGVARSGVQPTRHGRINGGAQLNEGRYFLSAAPPCSRSAHRPTLILDRAWFASA